MKKQTELTEAQKHALVKFVQDNYYDWLADLSRAAAEDAGIDEGDGHCDECDDDTCIHMQISCFVDMVVGEIQNDGLEKLTKKYGSEYIEIVEA